ncbi:MAG TPA: aldose epimerase family protein [Acidobacteriaceae bacterium]|jgi:aldose 1-epimerase
MEFGSLPDGSPVDLYTLKSASIEVRLITFGARVVALRTQDREGDLEDISLGFDRLDAYLRDTGTYFGVIAGRYANRIGGACFTLAGRTYRTHANNGRNTLHGGPEGFDRRNWSAREIADGVEFTLHSADGDEGFSGNLLVHVRYTLHGNVVRIEYSASTDKPTVVNLTNHAYFNLAGDGRGDILEHVLTLDADAYTLVDSESIPTGEIAPVAGTPFDFTTPHRMGERIAADNPQIRFGRGYDHNWVVRGEAGTLRPAAMVYEPASGRVLSVETTEPGLQFYSGNFLDGSFTGRNGTGYTQRTGFCLETQHYPDSPNHPAFPSTELRPGETLHSVTTWTFTSRAVGE